ncbi:carbohydrate kinase family protein [Bacillus sp. PS06]|uniref:carbohydrate kinase family protein n=1 Tax=Bacillus sp. PS06 TaxID=2764176 RepID=UPI00178322FA|nr:carbohydrate kinase [Bacillus sp. PS06]MBD8068167.1 carbohydrate kinase [Bacillus sp. PS06]
MSKQGIISLGEAFVDLIAEDQRNTSYKLFLGGATVNVAVGTSRLGVQSYYLCKLGTDETSQFVETKLKREGINTDFCIHSSNKSICRVYVHLNEFGDRLFHSYINESPDELLTEDELSIEVFRYAKLFYFGSGTLFHEIAHRTTERALTYARSTSTLVAFDTNIRIKRWESEDNCRNTINSFLNRADLVKMAEDELLFLTETDTLAKGLEKIAQFNIPYLFITLGKDGALGIYKGNQLFVPGIKVEAVDTTGAGDAFFAAILTCFHEKGKPRNHSQLKDYIKFANVEAARSTTKMGSL